MKLKRQSELEAFIRWAARQEDPSVPADALRSLRRKFARRQLDSARRGDSPARHAARIIDRSRRELTAARTALATATNASSPSVFSGPEWTPVLHAMRQHRERLVRIPTVVGFSVGFRRRAGEAVQERCVIVFVRRKHPLATLVKRSIARVPKSLRYGTRERVPTDVVELGRMRESFVPGSLIGQRSMKRVGTLGTFATDPNEGLVALTAMHVTGLRAFDASSGSDDLFFFLEDETPLGRLLLGTKTGIDAAKIAVHDPASALDRTPKIGPIQGWRPLSLSGDRGSLVRMYGAISGLVYGRIEEPLADLDETQLGSVILVDIPSADGDSGAALVDNQGFVLGLLVGETTGGPRWRVFSPIGPVLKRLGCEIPSVQET